MNKKRILALLLALLLSITLIGGCGGNGDAPGGGGDGEAATQDDGPLDLSLPIVDEPITLSVFWPPIGDAVNFITDFNCNPVWQLMEEQTGIHIDWFHGTVEQYNLMISAGDFTDIIMHDQDIGAQYPGGPDQGIEDGVILRLNEYLERYGKYYLPLIDSTPEFRRNSRTDTGNIWGFAMLETNIQGPWMGMSVRQDWLNALGMDTPVTYDDWHTMLVRFRDELDASVPMLLCATGFDWPDAFIAGHGVGRSFFQIDGEVHFGPIEQGYRDHVTMLAQWYAEGLIDQEFATRDHAGREQLITTAQVGAWFTGFWVFCQNRERSIDSDVFHQVAVPPPVRNPGETARLRQTNDNVRGFQTSVTPSSPYRVEAVRWLDNLYSPENIILLNYGIEGQAHEIIDGERIFTDLIVNNPRGMLESTAFFAYAMHHGPMVRIWDRAAYTWHPDWIEAHYIWAEATNCGVIPQQISMTAEEATEFASIMNDIETLVEERSVRFIMGIDDLGGFDEFVSQIISMNIDRAIEIKQAAVDRYYAR